MFSMGEGVRDGEKRLRGKERAYDVWTVGMRL